MSQLEDQLESLSSSVVEMGSLTVSMLCQAIDAVEKADVDATQPVFEAEKALDQLQLEIDKEAIRIMTVFSPVAGDLRLVLSVSRITAELERIGDHATNLCECLQLMTSRTDARPILEVIKMGGIVKEMVRNSLAAFGRKDSSLALLTIANDDMVDALNDLIVKKLLQDDIVREVIIAQKNIAGSLAQILIASSLERIADQATNICEEVVYMVKGSDIRHTTAR